MFILSGGFPSISVSQGMVLCFIHHSPVRKAAPLPTAVSQPSHSPLLRLDTSAPAQQRWHRAGDGVPTRSVVRWPITEHFTFSSFPSITFLQ